MSKIKDALLYAEETRHEEVQDALEHFDYYKLAALTWEASAKLNKEGE